MKLLLSCSRNLRHSTIRKMAAAESDRGAGKLEFVALRSLSPDREPRRGGVHKQLTVEDDTLSVKWTADTARVLRVSTSSFLDHLILVLETMQMFHSDTS